jgi:hypothetical protein
MFFILPFIQLIQQRRTFLIDQYTKKNFNSNDAYSKLMLNGNKLLKKKKTYKFPQMCMLFFIFKKANKFFYN